MKRKRALQVLALTISAPALLLGSLLAYEAIFVILSTSETIAAYHFGSESMIGLGGSAYTSQTNYVLRTAVPALLLITSAGVGIFGGLRKHEILCKISLLFAAAAATVFFL